MDKLVVKELIQHDLTTENIMTELNSILNNESKKLQIFEDYFTLKKLLATGGDASKNAAELIYGLFK